MGGQTVIFIVKSLTISTTFGKLLYQDPEVVIGDGFAVAPDIHRYGDPAADINEILPSRELKIVKSVSQFDDPNGWKPVKDPYITKDYTITHVNAPIFVTGAPYGDALIKKVQDSRQNMIIENSWKPFYNRLKHDNQKQDRVLLVEDVEYEKKKQSIVKDKKDAVEKSETDVGKFVQGCQQNLTSIYKKEAQIVCYQVDGNRIMETQKI